MNIFITGGTGLIGQALIPVLLNQQHQLSLLTRSEKKARRLFPQKNLRFFTSLTALKNLDEFDVVINLAGEPIFAKAWNEAQKATLFNSRVKLTEQIALLINAGLNPPRLISASATGIYGDGGNQLMNDENSTAFNTFSARLCQAWESAALQAKTTVCLLRTGIVLSPKGGALAKMLPLYRLNLAGRLGSGKQYWAWIALEDAVNAVLFLISNFDCKGIYNLTAPHPVTNSEFNRQLAAALHRCAPFPVPAFALKLALGERADMLLESQNVFPKRLLEAGFKFQYVNLKQYFTSLFPKK